MWFIHRHFPKWQKMKWLILTTNTIKWHSVWNTRNLKQPIAKLWLLRLWERVFQTQFCCRSTFFCLYFVLLTVTCVCCFTHDWFGLVPVIVAAPGQKMVNLPYTGVSSANVVTLTDWWLEVQLLALEERWKAEEKNTGLRGSGTDDSEWRTRRVWPTSAFFLSHRKSVIDASYSWMKAHFHFIMSMRRAGIVGGDNDLL